jgi:hypothetical protein
MDSLDRVFGSVLVFRKKYRFLRDRLRDEQVIEGIAVVHRQPCYLNYAQEPFGNPWERCLKQ